jgi:tetratricopeptide (TPR) repeat protein
MELVAKAAQKLGQADRALELIHRALLIDPDFAAGHHRLATLHFEKGQFAKALPCIERALALRPHDCRMLSRKGLILNRLERHDEAIAVFDQLIEREPGTTATGTTPPICIRTSANWPRPTPTTKRPWRWPSARMRCRTPTA